MKDIHQQIKKNLYQFIGAQNNEQTMQQVQKAIADLFPKTEGLQLHRVNTKNGWLTMSLKDKILWWISTRLFPKISETIRAHHHELLNYTDNPNCKIPLWAEKEPKNVCMVDVYVSVPKPVESINIDFSVEKFEKDSIIHL